MLAEPCGARMSVLRRLEATQIEWEEMVLLAVGRPSLISLGPGVAMISLEGKASPSSRSTAARPTSALHL